MSGVHTSRTWSVRVSIVVVVGLIGFVLAVLLHFEPHPLAFAAMVGVASSVAWLVIDTINTPSAQWVSELASSRDRIDEVNADHRILTTHRQANEPSNALRERLVALARGRDPALAMTLQAELPPDRRLRPTEIDRILTRIEESRDSI